MRAFVFLCFLVAMATGCMTAKKVPRKLDDMNSRFRGPVATWVTKNYPTTESRDTVADIAFIEMELPTEEALPFLAEDGYDSTKPCPPMPAAVRIKAPCPTSTVTIIKKDSAEIVATLETCQKIIELKEKQHEKELKKAAEEVRKAQKKAKGEARWKNISFGVNIGLIIIAALLGWLLKRR